MQNQGSNITYNTNIMLNAFGQENTNYIDTEFIEKLIKAINYTGICEIEWLYNPKQRKYNLIEINPRTWLWVELAKASGIDFIKDVIHILNGEEITKNKFYEN